MLALSACVAAYHRPVVARAVGRHALVDRRPLVRAVAAADECLTEAPDASAADACEVLDPEATLRRYLQLRTVLSGDPLPDTAVESLVRRVEAISEPGFDEERIWGEWQLCWQRNTAAAPRSQKALASRPAFANFMTDERGDKVFRNIVQLPADRLRIVADVAYTPPPEGSETPGRLASSIRRASVQLALGRRWGWRPLRLPLPLRGEGWLEVTHLSDHMRITRGNRGGIFVHLRPALLTREAAKQQPPAPLVTAASPPPAPPPAAVTTSVTSWYDRGIRLTPQLTPQLTPELTPPPPPPLEP